MFAQKRHVTRLEKWFDTSIEGLIACHQVLGFVTIFVGMPLLVLLAVCAGTTIVMLPLAWVFGWM